MVDKTTYIYGLWDPRDNALRYVGKSNDPKDRYRRHLRSYDIGVRSPCARWIHGLKMEDTKPLMKVIEEVSLSHWQERERWWIKVLEEQGIRLLNLTPGGDGGCEKGRPNKMKGKKRSKEFCERIGRGHKGKKFTRARREAIRRGLKRFYASPRSKKLKQKYSELCSERNRTNNPSKKGRVITEETKQRISASLKEYFAGLDERPSMSQSTKEALQAGYQEFLSNGGHEVLVQAARERKRGPKGKYRSED